MGFDDCLAIFPVALATGRTAVDHCISAVATSRVTIVSKRDTLGGGERFADSALGVVHPDATVAHI